MLKGGILILAAGRSRRFGADKRRARLPDGKTLLEASVRNAQGSGLPCLLCLSPGDGANPPVADVPLHIAAGAERGMGATLASGAGAVSDWDFVIVALGDMPWIRPDTLQAVAAAARRERIVVPSYEKQRGHPVAFGADFLPALRRLHGDRGGRAIVSAHPDAVCELAVNDPGVVSDVDKPTDIHGQKP